MGKDSGNNAPPDTDMTRMSGPWMPLQGPAKGAIGDLGAWYQSNASNPQYGPRVTGPMNYFQNEATRGMINKAKYGQNYFGDFSKSLGGYVGENAGDMPGSEFFGGLAGGTSPYGQAFQDIYGQAAGGANTNQAFDTLNRTAAGENVGSNPYLDALYGQGATALRQNFQESVNPTIEGLLSKTGGGSGSSVEALLKGQAQRNLGTSLSDLGTKVYGGAYDQDMGRMLSAAQSLPGLESTRLSSLGDAAKGQLNAALTGVQGQQANQNAAFSQNLQAGNALGQAYQNQFMPLNIMNQAGGQLAANEQANRQENQDIFRFNQQAPYNRIMQYLSGLGGVNSMAPNAGAVGSQYAQNVMQGQPNQFQQAIGNVTGLLGAAAPIAGAYWGPWGAAGGQMMQQMMQQQTPYGMQNSNPYGQW
jgi:hypothetical protein